MANIVYKAVVSAPSKPDKKYFGITENIFEKGFKTHTRDFYHKKYVNSFQRWLLWTCLKEKFWLLKHFNDEHLFNKKSEFISKWKHENKLLVKSAKKGCFTIAVLF